MANLTALWAARELRQVEEVVASEAAHLSVRKSAAILSLPFRAVEVDDDQRRCASGIDDLSRAALVLTARAVAAGAVDPLDVGSGAAWRHVDAAWAGPLRLSDQHASLLDAADSIAVSTHKWLFQPKECALVLFRDVDTAHEALSFGGGYLATANVGLLGSHGATALPLLATLLAWGQRSLAARVERCMALARELAELIERADGLELWRRPTTGVVLWRPRTQDARQVRQPLRGAAVSLADLGGDVWLRSVAANPLAEPARVVEAVLAAAADVEAAATSPPPQPSVTELPS